MTGFEPAASWSQTRRSSQAEPHPAVFLYLFVLRCPTQDILYVKQPQMSTPFFNFFDFFLKSDFLFLEKSLKPAKYKALRDFHFFQKNRFFVRKKGFFTGF